MSIMLFKHLFTIEKRTNGSYWIKSSPNCPHCMLDQTSRSFGLYVNLTNDPDMFVCYHHSIPIISYKRWLVLRRDAMKLLNDQLLTDEQKDELLKVGA